MKDISLQNINVENVQSAEEILISLLRAEYPNLDTSKGTVLRDLLIRPAAELYAVNNLRLEALSERYSVKQLSEVDSPNDYDLESVDLLLSNFLTTRKTGLKASGQLIMYVAYDSDYDLSNVIFVTADGNKYKATIDTVYSTGTTESVKLSAKDDFFYAIIPIKAIEAGSAYNVQKLTTFSVENDMAGFISAEAYTNIAGGKDYETPKEVIERLPEALAVKSLDNKVSITSHLKSVFPQITDLNVTGMGDLEQLRDKHYIVGVGGRIDVYPKTFFSMPTKLIEAVGVKIKPNTYALKLNKEDAAGVYLIKGVSDVPSGSSGSFQFTSKRSYDLGNSYHDFSIIPERCVIETAYTRYQTIELEVICVDNADTKTFYVEAYYTPQIDTIQAYLDDINVRSLYSDIVVRSPIVGITSLWCVIYPNGDVDTEAVKYTIFNYINSLKFGEVLSKSGIVAAIISKHNVARVDLSTATQSGMVLKTQFRKPNGDIQILEGNEINIDDYADALNMFTNKTTLFSIDLSDIYIQKTN